MSLRLWIITGGTPALAFSDWSFTERYKSLKKWDNKHYNNSKYDHQEERYPQGPTFEVLPNGLKDVQKFLDKYLDKRNLRTKRFKALPIQDLHRGQWGSMLDKQLKSKRFHDKVNRCYCHCTIDFRPNHISNVNVESSSYCGQDDELKHLFPKGWSELSATMMECSLTRKNFTFKNWEDLTEKQFETVCQAINDVR